MPFESLSERISATLKRVRHQKTLTEKNMADMLQEIRLALLEADVNYDVVREFIEDIKEKATGVEVMNSLTPGQMVVKIVHDELVTLLGTDVATVDFTRPFNIILMAGLQGSGKTTTAAKIALYAKEKHGKKPFLVACDVYRPAAVEQLVTLGESISVPVYAPGLDIKPEKIAADGVAKAQGEGCDTVIIDTAGRLHVDTDLMDELCRMAEAVQPTETLLVVDSLTGQDIVNVAQSFNERLSLTGAVLTKMDGDARGGGALSIRHMTGVPIKFIATGEKLTALDLFYPDRMADRILGMGDVMSLIEKAQDVIDENDAARSMQRLSSGSYGFDDMLENMHQVRRMGSLSGVLKMIPGVAGNMPNIDDEETNARMKKTEAIILSMTPQERRNPGILMASRKQRIAKGAGVTVAEVNRLLKQFENTRQMMGRMTQMAGMRPPKKNVYDPSRKKVRHKKKKR